MSKTIFNISINNTIFFTVKKKAQIVKSQLKTCQDVFSTCKKYEDDVPAVMLECQTPPSTTVAPGESTVSNATVPPELSSLSDIQLEQQKENLVKSVSDFKGYTLVSIFC